MGKYFKYDKRRRLHRKLMTLLSKLGIDDDTRHEMIYNFTRGRTGSTRLLSEDELIELINRLETDYNERLRRMRSEILLLATRAGIHDPFNWEKFNRFMIKRSIFHKPLPEYTLTELHALRRQFRSIEKKNRIQSMDLRLKPYQVN